MFSSPSPSPFSPPPLSLSTLSPLSPSTLSPLSPSTLSPLSPSTLSPLSPTFPPERSSGGPVGPGGSGRAGGSGGKSPIFSSSSVSDGLLVGLIAGGFGVLFLVGFVCFFCFRKKGHVSPPPLVKDHSYEQPQNWPNAPPPSDHVVKVAPSPPLPPFSPSPPDHLLHFHPPPPPPPFIVNSVGSGSSYSRTENPPHASLSFALSFSRNTFTYDELLMSTDGFSDANLLGQGGFGYVHRGMLPNGKEVAVKQLKSGSGQGEREFQAEVEIISRVHHKHLVSLVGCCIDKGKRILVYDFIPNNTLEFHLHGKGRPTLDWPTRLKIALGSAKGLAYLHEDCHPKIIHRDIKTSNILLDFKFEAKVADFGLAKIASDANTHITTRVMGTFGYLAPEYASSGKLTDKSDVFSFGVMLLELITGRQPYDSKQSFMDDSLVDWARPLLTRALDDMNFDAIVDPRLGKGYNSNEMRRMIACAAVSVRHSAKQRPKMSQIVRALEGDIFLDDMNEGVKQNQNSSFVSYESSDYDVMQYNENLKNFRRMAIGSEEYGGSGHSDQTSEYGQICSASSSEGRRELDLDSENGSRRNL